jgi:hypothetical protein
LTSAASTARLPIFQPSRLRNVILNPQLRESQ